MPGIKRIGLMILIFFGPGSLIYFLAKTVKNKFVELPCVGQHKYITNDQGEVIDTIHYTIPDFKLTTVDGKIITKNSIKDKFVVLTTLQNSCPDSCGVYLLHFNEIFYSKLYKNKDNYNNVVILSVITDHYGNPVKEVDDVFVQKMNEIENFDPSLWWVTTGNPKPLFDFEFNDTNFYDLPSHRNLNEIGSKTFLNSLVLLDRASHVRGFTGARSFSDISNFFDLLKILKKVEFDEKHNL